jgi:hypothetical protein
MSKRTDHESCAFALLQSANPTAAEDIRRELDDERVAAARARARAVLEADHQVGPIDRGAGRSPRDGRRVRLVGAAAAAVALAMTGLLAVLTGGGEPARAQQVLNAAASLAAAQPAAAPGLGEYTYVKQRGGLVGGPSETVEWWIALDGSGRMRRTGPQAIGVISYADGRRRQLPATVVGGHRAPRDVTFGPGRFAELYGSINPGLLNGRIDELPTEPEALDAVLRQKLRGALDFNPDPGTQSLQMLQLIEEILANPLASPKLRSAVYEIAARLEGVEIREHATDPVGRPATAIALCSAAIPARYEVFFEEATSATLGTREFDVPSCDNARSHRSSGLIGYNVYLEQGTVDSVHQQP